MLNDCSLEQLEDFMRACQTLLLTSESLTGIHIGMPIYTELHLYRCKVALKVASGELRKRDTIPNREVCDRYGVPTYTVSRAKNLLAKHGLLEKINGVYFVA